MKTKLIILGLISIVVLFFCIEQPLPKYPSVEPLSINQKDGFIQVYYYARSQYRQLKRYFILDFELHENILNHYRITKIELLAHDRIKPTISKVYYDSKIKNEWINNDNLQQVHYFVVYLAPIGENPPNILNEIKNCSGLVYYK